MQTELFDFAIRDASAGFRLQGLEVYNWGTFERRVWRIEPHGHNALLTGDIGSGKSTLVDAITTLFVPHHRIVYNKAAGAEGKERSLYSYIRGEYKSEKDDLSLAAKAVTLRDENTYTVLLGYFYNEGFDQGVTLAQVFWLKDQQRNPERFFVVAQKRLTVAENFSGFGTNILDLRKRLRHAEHVEVIENFKDYSSRFRRLFGIKNDQALDLFYQTVSMKSVGNLTEFVRNHMLEKCDVDSRIEELRRNFDNLNRAHEAVLKAKRQIERLTPLVEDGKRYRSLARTIDELRHCREALVAYFATHKVELLTTQIDQLALQIKKLSQRLEQLTRDISHLRHQESDLKTNIDESGGRRLHSLAQEITRLSAERDRKSANDARYREHAARLGLKGPSNADEFYDNLKEAEGLLQQLDHELNQQKQTEIDHAISLKEVDEQHRSLGAELTSLRKRKNNIPLRNLEIRRDMVKTLGIEDDTLPFVGELLQIDEEEPEWEGAIERVLHNFGLSLLVPEALYAQVSHYVDRTRLQGRLVYFKVNLTVKPTNQVLDPRLLPRKLRIKPDSPFYSWLDNQLVQRFDYMCCDTLETFRRLPKAITRNGQIKSAGQRHEKDDRRAIQDRSHYVLGWSNQAKIRALETKQRQLENEAQRLGEMLAQLLKTQKELNERRDAVRDLLGVEEYSEIHWQSLAASIQALVTEKKHIEDSSNILQSLQRQLQQLQQTILKNEEQERALTKDAGKLEERLSANRLELDETQQLSTLLSVEEQQTWFPKIDAFREQALSGAKLSLVNLDKTQRQVRDHIQKRLDNEEQKSKRVTERLIKAMQSYKTDYPVETAEVDASLAAVPDYANMLQNLNTEDLPRHEMRFKQLLNEGTIHSVALFQNQLEREKKEIEDKISAINTSLREIEYDPGTYIELVLDKTQDKDIREFQQDLRQCLAHSLDESELYNEQKFLQVKAIIDRFNGREGLVDLDRKWTRKVTDVRNWSTFSASERWLEDGSEKEFYSDSSGKSGGQKEKLAYTILASALAYQFGLEWNAVQSRSFRFVVIDEAFGRGSDESTRYGLELFKKLNLQLLIVTPLQKIHIIEDYIASVHYIHNEDGRNSMIRNLTVDEYRAEKQQYLRASEV